MLLAPLLALPLSFFLYYRYYFIFTYSSRLGGTALTRKSVGLSGYNIETIVLGSKFCINLKVI